jgi:hypothetical protein
MEITSKEDVDPKGRISPILTNFKNQFYLSVIDECEDFWCLIDSIVGDMDRDLQTHKEKKGFYHHRTIILEAFQQGRLFGLRTINEEVSEICCPGSLYLLPCFCIVDPENKKEAIMIWTESRYRCKGLGKSLLKKLDIESARGISLKSVDFWIKCGFSLSVRRYKK